MKGFGEVIKHGGIASLIREDYSFLSVFVVIQPRERPSKFSKKIKGSVLVTKPMLVEDQAIYHDGIILVVHV